MAFPTTSVIETFTNASSVNLSVHNANWAGMGLDGTANQLKTSGVNTCQSGAASGTYTADYRTDISSADLEVYVTMPTITSANDMSLFIRAQAAGAAGTTNAYNLVKNAGGSTWDLYKYVLGVQSLITAAIITQAISAGDSWGMSVVGTTITFYYKAAAGSWSSLGTKVDSSVSGAGSIGLETSNSVVRFDDFGGGAIASSALAAGQEKIRFIEQGVNRASRY